MKVVIATVTQEGRFLKAITSEGKDVSNLIDRGLRRQAAETNQQLMLDDVTGSWSFANTVAQAQESEPVELVEDRKSVV